MAASQIGTISGSVPGGGLLMWSSAIIGGGGVAALVQSATVGTRAVSTATTAGLANPIINLGQSIVSVVLSVASIVAPFVVVAILLVVGLIGWRVVAKSRLTRARATRTLA